MGMVYIPCTFFCVCVWNCQYKWHCGFQACTGGMELGIWKFKSLIFYNICKDLTKHQAAKWNCQGALCLGWSRDLLQFQHPRWQTGYLLKNLSKCSLLSPVLLLPRGRGTAAGKCTAVTVTGSSRARTLQQLLHICPKGGVGGQKTKVTSRGRLDCSSPTHTTCLKAPWAQGCLQDLV